MSCEISLFPGCSIWVLSDSFNSKGGVGSPPVPPGPQTLPLQVWPQSKSAASHVQYLGCCCPWEQESCEFVVCHYQFHSSAVHTHWISNFPGCFDNFFPDNPATVISSLFVQCTLQFVKPQMRERHSIYWVVCVCKCLLMFCSLSGYHCVIPGGPVPTSYSRGLVWEPQQSPLEKQTVKVYTVFSLALPPLSLSLSADWIELYTEALQMQEPLVSSTEQTSIYQVLINYTVVLLYVLITSCMALGDLLVGQQVKDVANYLPSLWELSLRARDDIKVQYNIHIMHSKLVKEWN